MEGTLDERGRAAKGKHDLLCPEPNLMVVSILSPRDGADEGVNVYVGRSGNDWR